MTSKRELYEIEVGLALTNDYNYIKNLVVFNINGTSSIMYLDHECDVLVLSKAGYLTEIEIKRSWEDFKADFKKRCYHNACGVIKNFYYCVSELFADKVIDYIEEHKILCDGVLIYNEEGEMKFEVHYFGIEHQDSERWNVHKLYLEQQLYIAKLGCMRAIGMREKLITNPDFKVWKLIENYNYEKEEQETFKGTIF